MEATILVSEAVSRALRGRVPSTGEAAQLMALLDERGLSLEPMHPGVSDGELQSYFIMQLPNDNRAEEILDLLQHAAGVEAAYVKPPDALP